MICLPFVATCVLLLANCGCLPHLLPALGVRAELDHHWTVLHPHPPPVAILCSRLPEPLVPAAAVPHFPFFDSGCVRLQNLLWKNFGLHLRFDSAFSHRISRTVSVCVKNRPNTPKPKFLMLQFHLKSSSLQMGISETLKWTYIH